MDESKMTRDDIVRMALEAGFAKGVAELLGLKKFARFAALVAAAEREECAKVCDDYAVKFDQDRFYWDTAATNCSDAIRARGKE